MRVRTNWGGSKVLARRGNCLLGPYLHGMLLVEIHAVVRLGVGALVARLLLLLAGRLLGIPHLLGILALLLPVVPILLPVVLIPLLLAVPIQRGPQMAGSVGRISSWPSQRPS